MENNANWKKKILEEEDRWVCRYCGTSFDKDQIYPWGDQLLTAKGRAKRHALEHDPVKEMLKHPRSYTGLTEVQELFIPLLHEGLRDEEIAARMRISPSTVRNHRFRLKEKERQARRFLELMDALHWEEPSSAPPHRGATMVDDRYAFTEEEAKKTLLAHMTPEGALKSFPAREKKKIIVLGKIAENFVPGTAYSEAEVNRILQRIFEDHVLLRRYLIEYGFLDRSRDGALYMRREEEYTE